MLTNNISKAVLFGNGIATEFPFNFKVWDMSQLIVSVVDDNGVEVIVNNWSVSLGELGGTVTYLHSGSPLPEGYKLIILRNMPFKQEVDLITGTRFDPQVIEDALDKATAERQQLFEAVERSIKTRPTDTVTPDDLILELRQSAAVAIESASTASVFADTAQINMEQSTQNASFAESSAQLAQEWAQKAKQDVSSFVLQVTDEGTRQVGLVQEEGARQRENTTQTITPDPTQASPSKIPSEQAVSQALANFDIGAAHIVEMWKNPNGAGWYIKYSNGFIMQGGFAGSGTSAIGAITNFHVPFTDTNYSFVFMQAIDGYTATLVPTNLHTKTTSYVKLVTIQQTNRLNGSYIAMGY